MSIEVFKWNKSKDKVIEDCGINREFYIGVSETAARYMAPFVPRKEGVLFSNYITGADEKGGYVTYTSPYAQHQYYGIGFQHTKDFHPLATSEWDKAMMKAKGEQYVNEVNKLRKRYAK